MQTRRLLDTVRVLAIALVLVAVVAQAIELANNDRFDATRFFAFFTIQSNLIGVVALGLVLATRGGPRSRALELLRGAAAVYLTITFVVVITLLSGVDVQLQLAWVDFVLHKLFPIVVVADLLIDPPRVRLAMRDALIWLVYPLIWVGVTLVRGAADGWYPYPFLDPTDGGYGQVAISVIAITVGFAVIAGIVIALGNARSSGRRASPPG